MRQYGIALSLRLITRDWRQLRQSVRLGWTENAWTTCHRELGKCKSNRAEEQLHKILSNRAKLKKFSRIFSCNCQASQAEKNKKNW